MKNFKQKSHFVHLFGAIRYAFSGLCVLSREIAFIHEICFLIATVMIFFLKDISITYYIIFFILWFFLVAVEALNTAIEMIVDRISPEISVFAKQSKDLASFAVFLLVIANLLFVVSVSLKLL